MKTVKINTLDLFKIIAENTSKFGDPFLGIYTDKNGNLFVSTLQNSGNSMHILPFSGMGEFIDSEGRYPDDRLYDSIGVAKYLIEDKECLKLNGWITDNKGFKEDYTFKLYLNRTVDHLNASAQTLPPSSMRAQCYSLVQQIKGRGNASIAAAVLRDHVNTGQASRAASLIVDAGAAVEVNARSGLYGKFVFEDLSSF